MADREREVDHRFQIEDLAAPEILASAQREERNQDAGRARKSHTQNCVGFRRGCETYRANSLTCQPSSHSSAIKVSTSGGQTSTRASRRQTCALRMVASSSLINSCPTGERYAARQASCESKTRIAHR